MERKRLLDSMCIGIEKIAETDESAQYAFISDVYEPDPNHSSRMTIAGQNQGILQIDKATGEITLLEEMPEDIDNKRFLRAAIKIKKHWQSGDLPHKTLFASG